MTEIIQADADHITITDRSAVIVMDAEWPMDRDAPPPEQVRRLTEPCETCKGRGYVGHDSLMTSTTWKACPDCHNGKPTFTLHQTKPWPWVDEDGDEAIQTIHLGDGWAITDVLPIYDMHDKEWPVPSAVIGGSLDNVGIQGPPGTPIKVITLPSAARPGQYAILCEQEAS